jgi:hypothetical protein
MAWCVINSLWRGAQLIIYGVVRNSLWCGGKIIVWLGALLILYGVVRN